MKTFYTLLFAFSIIIINPWGLSRGEIWTTPKVLVIVTIVFLNLCLLWENRVALTFPRSWKISLVLWVVFLGIGLISTLLSPVPMLSLLGQNQMGDGWLYWLLIATFTLSNTLLLRLYPELLPSQLRGLSIGSVILSISIFPQIIDWRIDYTATMGQLLRDNVLASTIFQNQQPIGLFSHRGHASFVLAAVIVLFLVAWRWEWISSRWLVITVPLMFLALLLTQTRAAIVSIIGSAAFLLDRKYYKLLIPVSLLSLLIVGITTTTRHIDNLPLIKQITSDRIYLWELSSKGISQRPLFGWGFDGFGSAYPYIVKPNKIEKIVRVGDYNVDYQDKKGQVRSLTLPTFKAHNPILDTTLSVGVLGLLSYLGLIIFAVKETIRSTYRGIEAVAIAYLIFTLTWFECAQFTHIFWWALSLWGVHDPAVGDRNFIWAIELSNAAH